MTEILRVDSIQALPQDKIDEAKAGRWYHCGSRVYIVQIEGKDIAAVRLEWHQRIYAAFISLLGMNYFESIFDTKVVTLLDEDQIERLRSIPTPPPVSPIASNPVQGPIIASNPFVPIFVDPPLPLPAFSTASNQVPTPITAPKPVVSTVVDPLPLPVSPPQVALSPEVTFKVRGEDQQTTIHKYPQQALSVLSQWYERDDTRGPRLKKYLSMQGDIQISEKEFSDLLLPLKDLIFSATLRSMLFKEYNSTQSQPFHDYLLDQIQARDELSFQEWLRWAVKDNPDRKGPVLQLFGESLGTHALEDEKTRSKFLTWLNKLYNNKTEITPELFEVHKKLLLKVLETPGAVNIFKKLDAFNDIWNKAPEEMRLKAALFFTDDGCNKLLLDSLEKYATDNNRMVNHLKECDHLLTLVFRERYFRVEPYERPAWLLSNYWAGLASDPQFPKLYAAYRKC